MTDILSGSAPEGTTDKIRRTLSRRHRKQYILQGLGIAAISIAFLMLFILIASLVSTGYKAFTQTQATLEVFIDPAEVSLDSLPRGDFDDILDAAVVSHLPSVDPTNRAAMRAIGGILSNGAQFQLRDRVVADPSLIGQTDQPDGAGF